MSGLLIGLWFVVAAADLPASSVPDDAVAINPNLPFAACDGGASVMTVGQRLPEARIAGAFAGQLAPTDALSGGDVSWCPGYYPPHAQVCLIVRDAGDYQIRVTDSEDLDTVLAVEIQPDYFTCDDDSAGGLRPLITTWLEPGQYRIFVGSFSQGVSGRFAIQAGRHSY